MDIVPEKQAGYEKYGGQPMVDPKTNKSFDGKGDLVDPKDQQRMSRMFKSGRRLANADIAGAGKKGAGSGRLSALQQGMSAAKKGITLARDMLRQIKPTQDWPFLCLALPFSLLKDIIDIVVAAIPGVGIVVSFITTVLLIILTAVCLLLIGEKVKSRKSGKYIAGFSVEFISEILPGISWLPLAFVETIIIYCFILYDRATSPKEKEEDSSQPEPEYADGYQQQEAA